MRLVYNNCRLVRLIFAILITFGVLVGCTQEPGPLTPPKRTGEPIGVQFMRIQPVYNSIPFRILLDFESESDLAFIGGCAGAATNGEVAHTGLKCLKIPADCRSFTIRTASMFSSRPFPGEWTFFGGYFIAYQPTQVEITYELQGKILASTAVAIPARRLTPVKLDLSSIPGFGSKNEVKGTTGNEVGVIKVSVSGQVYCDDIFVANNRQNVISQGEKTGDYWSVYREGYSLVIGRPGLFEDVRLPMSEESKDGWVIESADDFRLILTDQKAKQRWVIYPDGRGFLNSTFKPIRKFTAEESASFTEQQQSTGEIVIAEDQGRVERNSTGDVNHDGYNESDGTYQIKANGARLEFKLTPQNHKIIRPIFEVAGMPKGRLVINVEGKVVDKFSWTKNGNALFELPIIVDRPITVELKSQ